MTDLNVCTMLNTTQRYVISLGLGLMILMGFASACLAMGTAFTYQGQLTGTGGTPVNASCDFRFILYNALIGGSQVGPIVTKTGVTVTNGLFTTTLDFGTGAFPGSARWLEIGAKCGAESSYTVLSPRQELTPTPYALNADLVDGQQASAFAAASHNHTGENITSGTVADARIASTIARDSEIMPTVLANDGPGSMLNADYLDGSSSSAFQKDIVLASSTTDATTYFTTSCANYSGGSVTISATGAGVVIIEANVWVILTHTNGIADRLNLGLGSSATDCGSYTNRVVWEIPSTYPNSTEQDMTFTVRRRFTVGGAGSYTYYLNGFMDAGYAASTDAFYYAEMIATFYPD